MIGILLDNDFNLRIEPKYDENGLITSGLVLGDINYQRISLITQMQKGACKENPVLGFAIERFNKAQERDVKQRFVNELEKELAADGLKAKVTVGDKLSTFSVNVL